jgi:hypothetical protein
MSLLHVFKTKKQPLEFVLPRKGPIDTRPQGMDGCIEEAFASTLGALAMTEILFDVGDHTGIENALPITCGIKAAIEIDIGASEVQPNLFGHLLQRLETLWKQHHVRGIHGSDWQGREDVAMVFGDGDDLLPFLMLIA